MNNKAQMEVIASPAFVVLVVMAVGATLIGWTLGPQLGFEDRFPLWQLLIIVAVEIIAAYIITLRMS
jgi:low affinity Fe/Cu permease